MLSQLFLSVRCVLSFMSRLLFHLLLPFFRITVTLMSCWFCFSFRFNSSFLFVASAPSSFFRFNSPLPFVNHLLLPFFRINSYVLIVQSFLPFQLFLSIRCVCACVSTLLSCSFNFSFPFNSSISLRPSFCFNSSLLFVISFLSFQLSPHVSQKT